MWCKFYFQSVWERRRKGGNRRRELEVNQRILGGLSSWNDQGWLHYRQESTCGKGMFLWRFFLCQNITCQMYTLFYFFQTEDLQKSWLFYECHKKTFLLVIKCSWQKISNKINQFGLLKVSSYSVFDMIVESNKHLILDRATLREGLLVPIPSSMSHHYHQANNSHCPMMEDSYFFWLSNFGW